MKYKNQKGNVGINYFLCKFITDLEPKSDSS